MSSNNNNNRKKPHPTKKNNGAESWVQIAIFKHPNRRCDFRGAGNCPNATEARFRLRCSYTCDKPMLKWPPGSWTLGSPSTYLNLDPQDLLIRNCQADMHFILLLANSQWSNTGSQTTRRCLCVPPQAPVVPPRFPGEAGRGHISIRDFTAA